MSSANTVCRTLVLGTLVFLLFFAATERAMADQRIALADFIVHSDNPQYSYLGKGISEMIAVELSKSPGVTLVDREKRVQLMEEMEFALSSLAEDADKQVQVGKMLAADYLIFGEIVDMAPQLLISVRVTSVESGEVVFRDTLTEKAGNYEYISGYFAAAVLSNFEVKVAESTQKKTEEKVEKDEEAVVAFSRAIAAYDRDEREEAKKELKRAKRIDPEYEAARIYLNKLESVSPKFRVETDYYAPTSNPAYLGFLKEDMISSWQGNSIPPPEADAVNYQKVGADYLLKEYPRTTRFGYALPLGSRVGIGVEFFRSYMENWINATFNYEIEGVPYNESKDQRDDIGAFLNAGMLLTDNLSAGASIHATYSKPYSGGTINVAEEELSLGGAVGVIYTFADGRFTTDLQVSFDSKTDWYLDETVPALKSGNLPLIIDSTFIATFFDARLIAALKGIADVYFDSRGGYSLRLIPIAEFWLFPFLSLRGGYEYVHLDQLGSFTIGSGFMAGVSAQFWRLTLNFNYTLRKKPSRQIPGYLIDESYILVGVTYNAGWVTRD